MNFTDQKIQLIKVEVDNVKAKLAEKEKKLVLIKRKLDEREAALTLREQKVNQIEGQQGILTEPTNLLSLNESSLLDQSLGSSNLSVLISKDVLGENQPQNEPQKNLLQIDELREQLEQSQLHGANLQNEILHLRNENEILQSQRVGAIQREQMNDQPSISTTLNEENERKIKLKCENYENTINSMQKSLERHLENEQIARADLLVMREEIKQMSTMLENLAKLDQYSPIYK